MLPFLSMVLASMLAGSMVLVSDLVIQGFPRFTAAAIRYAISSSVLVPVALLHGGMVRLPARDWGLLTFQAATGTVIFMILFLQGVHLAGPVNAGVAAGLLPALISLTGFVLLKERMKAHEKAAVGCASAGLIMLAISRQNGSGPSMLEGAQMLGLVCLILAYWADALFTVLSKRLSTPVSAFFIAASMSGLGFLLSLGPALVETWLYGWPHAQTSQWLAILWFAGGPTILSFLLWYWGMGRSSAAAAGVAIAAMPISAVLMAWIWLDADVSASQLVALGFVLIGFLLVFIRNGVSRMISIFAGVGSTR
jgi:drug/metabolite transporter (DMT)-like permease